MKSSIAILILFCLSLAGLAGCQTAQRDFNNSQEINPTLSNLTIITPQSQTTPPGKVGPPPPPSGAPVRENASLVTVEILSLNYEKDKPDYVVVHALVTATEPVEGLDAFDPNLVGQEIDIYMMAGEAASLEVGNIIKTTISYRGDEWGGGYYGGMAIDQR
jgi:hypothetical protein